MSNPLSSDPEKPTSKDDKPFQWTLSNIIRLLREFALLLVLVYLSFKIISGNIGVSFGTKALTASEIISILLAFFAILLSAAFYYMSTQQSNLFYHNVHQFTKDTSEILGRLDEQVKGLGGRQTELKDTIEKNYAYNNSNSLSDNKKEKITEEVQEKTANLKEMETNIIQTINSLVEKATFPSIEEKDQLVSTLHQQRSEIENLRADLNQTQHLINLLHDVRNYINRIIRKEYLDLIPAVSPTTLFKKIINDSDIPEFKSDLRDLGFIEYSELNNYTFTREGIKFIREIIQEIDKR